MQCTTIYVLTILASAALVNCEITLEEYGMRQEIINKLSATYDQYRITNPNHEDKRESFLKEFMDLFKGQFDTSDEWILKAVESDDGIVEETTKSNGFDFPATKSFMESVSELYEVATLQRIRYEIHCNNFTEAERLEGALDEGKTVIQKEMNQTLNLIETKIYATQFKTDVIGLVKDNKDVKALPDLIVQMLKKKFPFRSWVVVLFDPSLGEHYMCPNGDLFQTSAAKNRRLIVFHKDVAARSNTAYASSLLAKVDESKKAWWHSCDGRGEEIMKEEANYSCSRKSFLFAGVFEFDAGLPTIKASNPSLINTKLTYRARLTFFCQAYFRVMFLG